MVLKFYIITFFHLLKSIELIIVLSNLYASGCLHCFNHFWCHEVSRLF